MDAVPQVPPPRNEPPHDHAAGSPERTALEARLKELAAEPVDLPMTIGGEHRLGGGEPIEGPSRTGRRRCWAAWATPPPPTHGPR